MKNRFSISCMLLFCFCSTFFISSCKKKKDEEVIDCSGASPSYSDNVKVIINNNCLSAGCHNAGSVNGDYTSFDELKKDAESGVLENRVITHKTMPVSGSLSLADRKTIKCWIATGALNN